jgi:hypothetical protein
MNSQNHLISEKKLEEKIKRREKKKKGRMRVSGVGVKKLQKIIVKTVIS